MIELETTYNPKNYEKTWYQQWLDLGLFTAKVDKSQQPYVIIMPPPNVTSQLHMGHGTGYTLQDLLIRWKRMRGFNACWLPGTDHAGIATQMMVEKSLEAEGVSRRALGREKFIGKLWDWNKKYGGMILEQFKSMGFSCDWSRLAFTMDPKLSHAVRYVFIKLYEEGLIYRGERLVNWDPVLLTAISDDEVETKEIGGNLWYFRYPVEGSDEFIPIATTRPETMLGDTAVAVNPDDERFRHLVGKKVRLPFVDRLIPIIGDEYVKSEFGTGAVKITPAHDPNDFAVGKRHNLPMINVMNEDATMADNCPPRFRGLDRFAARKEIIRSLKELNLFDKDEPHKHAVPHSERSKAVIEPRLSLQWWVKMESLAKPAADKARSGELRFYPESWKKTYLYWLDNIQDWCISRQLWWGHRIPIWYCQECSAQTTGMTDPTQCGKCGSKNIKQDEDVLDTWFSSWLWPLSPFGWPEQDQESQANLNYFFPSNVLVTAPEIIFLWVARMVMAGLKFENKLPFKDVYFNATVCDKQGRKFSKTLGNGIDPLEVIDAHGADAVRFTAVSLAPLGGRVRMDKTDFETGARFVNKLWNASRFLFRYLDSNAKITPLKELPLDMQSKWLITRLAETGQTMNTLMEQYRINEAVEQLYHFIWGDFCDWGIECAKESLGGADATAKACAVSVLVYTLDGLLRLAHPVMPFITEEIWQKLPKHPDWDRPKSISIANYPTGEKMLKFATETEHWSRVQTLVTGIRSVRAQAEINPKEPLIAHIRADQELAKIFTQSAALIKRLAGLKDLQTSPTMSKPAHSLSCVSAGFEAYLPVAGLLDIAKERQRLENEIKRISKIVTGLDNKLANKDFVARAPEDVIATTKAQQQNMAGQLKILQQNLQSLS